MNNRFLPGEVWLDGSGKPIQAHGGGVLYDRGTYYWFGENRASDLDAERSWRGHGIGVRCYSSVDLYHWKDEGLALPPAKDDPSSDLHPGRVVERPKVIFNEDTRSYVMWMHIDTPDYRAARAGVAVSRTPTGPYEYLGSVKPNGADSRDMTVFKDENGAAYLFHSSEWNKTMYIGRLTDDYLSTTGEYAREFIGRSREAPAVFKHQGRYFCITSGCSGWDPNAAEYAVADSIMGPWEVRGNPCVGTTEEIETTFHAQSTFVLPVEGREGAHIFMADRWKPRDLGDSRYIWLPIEISDHSLSLRWSDEWDLSVFD
jgi:hypothetical protein